MNVDGDWFYHADFVGFDSFVFLTFFYYFYFLNVKFGLQEFETISDFLIFECQTKSMNLI